MEKQGYKFVSYNDFLLEDNNKKILLTFDDGRKGIEDKLLKFLSNKNIPFMIFILTEPFKNKNFIMDVYSEFRENNTEYFFNENDILTLKSNGVAIGFHTRSHYIIKEDAILDKNFDKEIQIEDIYTNLFTKPLAFAYPSQSPHSYEKYDEIIINKGFVNIFDTRWWKSDTKNHFFRMPMDVWKGALCRNCILYNLKRSLLRRMALLDLFRR